MMSAPIPALLLALALQATAPTGTPPADQPGPAAPPAQAMTDGRLRVSVRVPSRSVPWLVASNRKMKFGKNDGAPPVRITGFANDADGKIAIMPEGSTTVAGKPVATDGIEGDEVDDIDFAKGVHYPSFYVAKLLYPVRRHALIGVFADAGGKMMTRPFPIRAPGIEVKIPEGAIALQLGFNDGSFAGNAGELGVTVLMPEP